MPVAHHNATDWTRQWHRLEHAVFVLVAVLSLDVSPTANAVHLQRTEHLLLGRVTFLQIRQTIDCRDITQA